MADQVLKYALSGDSSGATAAFKDVAAAIQRTEDKADKFASSVDKLKESFQRQVAGMSQHSAAIERQVSGMGRAGLETERMVGQTSRLGGAFASFAGNLAAFGAANLMGNITNALASTVQYGAAIMDMSERTKISTGDLQVFGAWADFSGTSTESLAKAVAKLETNIATGSKTLRGFGIDATNGKDALLQVIRAVEKAESDFDKVAIANAAFGRSWAELMPMLDAGAEKLQEISDNTSLIDEQSLENLAELDDRMLQLRNNTRSFAAEFMAAFGPAMSEILQGMAVEVRNLKDAWGKEDRDDFLSRIGAKKVGRTFVVDSKIDPSKLATKDLFRLMEVKADKDDDVVFSDQDDRFRRMHSVYLAKVRADEKENADKIAKDKADKLAEQRRQESMANAEQTQKRMESESKFQGQINREAELMRATEDARELLRLEQKYAALIEAHRGYSESILAIERAREAELQNYHMQRNFGRLGQERDSEAPGEGEQNTWWADSGKAFSSARGETYESYSMRNPGGVSEDSASAESARSKVSPLGLEQAKTDMEDLEKSWQNLADSIAERASGELAPAIIAVFRRGNDALSKLGDAAGNIMEGLLQDTAKLIIKWLILKTLSSAMGGGAEGPGGLGGFLMKGMGGGHADGTLSSPGGLKYLGERGPEPYETPYGQRGIATYGLYQVPAGTRVQSAGSGASIGAKEFHLHTTEADPIQVGEIFRRVVREEIVLHEASVYRDRSQIT